MTKSNGKHISQFMDDFKKSNHGSARALLCLSWVNVSDRICWISVNLLSPRN